MKNMLPFLTCLLFFTISIPFYSQVSLRTNKYDELEKQFVKETHVSFFPFKRSPDSIEGICISIGSLSNADDTIQYIDLSITTTKENLGCLNEYDGHSVYSGVALIKLIDGTILECLQINDTDCPKDSISDNYWLRGRYLLLTRDNNNSELQLKEISKKNWEKLAKIPVEKIRIYGSKHYCEYFPNPDFNDFPAQNIFIEHLKALK